MNNNKKMITWDLIEPQENLIVTFNDINRNKIEVELLEEKDVWQTPEEYGDDIMVFPSGVRIQAYRVTLNDTELKPFFKLQVERLHLGSYSRDEESCPLAECPGFKPFLDIINNSNESKKKSIFSRLKKDHFVGSVRGVDVYDLAVEICRKSTGSTNDIERAENILTGVYEYISIFHEYDGLESIQSIRNFVEERDDVNASFNMAQTAVDIGMVSKSYCKVPPEDFIEFIENERESNVLN